MEATDEDLIQRYRLGEEWAFEELVRRWDDSVLNLAWRLCGDLDEAQDVRQAAFLKTYAALEDFDGRARFSTWVHRIVLNMCRDRLRSRRSRRELVERAGHNGHARADGELSPLAVTEMHDTARVVAGAVEELEEAQREVVVLRHYQELSFPEIAEILGAPVTTVKSRMGQGLSCLRQRLNGLKPSRD